MWRKTPQTLLIRELLLRKGHATNQELAVEARKVYPSMTNTTVHRITSRLVDIGLASYAPSLHNVRVIDANAADHDHFICRACNRVFDISLSDDVFGFLEEQLPGKLSRHNVLVAGVCEVCTE